MSEVNNTISCEKLASMKFNNGNKWTNEKLSKIKSSAKNFLMKKAIKPEVASFLKNHCLYNDITDESLISFIELQQRIFKYIEDNNLKNGKYLAYNSDPEFSKIIFIDGLEDRINENGIELICTIKLIQKMFQ